MKKILRVMKVCCPTCPFRKDGWTELQGHIAVSALTEALRICHSTGPKALKKPRLFKDAHLCRGARDLQLRVFASMGFITDATEEAWAAKVKELGISSIISPG